MGLGAPRWAQILWSTSNMGQYLPWTVGPVASGVAGRSLWLWLGVLDAVQGVGMSLHRVSTFMSLMRMLLHQHAHYRRADTSTHHVRLRNDPSPDLDPFPRPLHADRRANARLTRNNRRASYRARQNRSWERISKLLYRSSRGISIGVVLDYIAFPIGRANRVWDVFPEGAAE